MFIHIFAVKLFADLIYTATPEPVMEHVEDPLHGVCFRFPCIMEKHLQLENTSQKFRTTLVLTMMIISFIVFWK